MAVKNKATLKADLAALLFESGQGHIDPVSLRTKLDEIIDSFTNLVDNVSLLGLKRLDETRVYGSGEGFIYSGAIYESKNGHLPGMNPNNPQGAIFTRLTSVPTIQNFDEWSNDTAYAIGDTVRREFRLFESLVANNTGNDPLLETYPGSIIWKEVSASENKWGEDYVVGTYYTRRQVVYNAGTFYWLNIVADTMKSVDFANELAEGKWVAIGSAGGDGAAAEILAADIAERDAYIDQMESGDYIFVTDASADSTVDSGWAKYKLNSDNSWTKVAEQEGLDLLYQKTGRNEGYKQVSSLTYTLLIGDIGKHIGMANVDPQTVIIPLDFAAVDGSYYDFQQELQGQLEFDPADGVTILGISNVAGAWKIELRYGGARLTKIGANTYSLIGNLEL